MSDGVQSVAAVESAISATATEVHSKYVELLSHFRLNYVYLEKRAKSEYARACLKRARECLSDVSAAISNVEGTLAVCNLLVKTSASMDQGEVERRMNQIDELAAALADRTRSAQESVAEAVQNLKLGIGDSTAPGFAAVLNLSERIKRDFPSLVERVREICARAQDAARP